MRNSRAFTLVELLVVIAIIALLISILAPSLNAAKNIAKQAICATNLHSIGMASSLYGEANNGNLPKVDGIKHSPALAEPYAWPVKLVNDGSGRNTPYGGLGNLHFAELVSADALYCPLMPTVPDAPIMWLRKSYPDPYGLKRLDNIGTVNFFAGYSWNPTIDVASTGGRGVTRFNKLERFASSAFMAMDLYFRECDIAHWLAGPTTPSWQVAYFGGSVSLKQSADGYKFMKELAGSDDMYSSPALYQKGLEYIEGKL